MNQNNAYGFLHCHSDNSLKDSPLKVKDLCRKAKEMGAKAVALTDHGACTGIIEFMRTCKDMDLNGIPGVEAYVKTEYAPHAHLLLLAKNYEGYQEISRAVTESNQHLETVGGIAMPIMDKELLKKHFGNGNVIATSACISGVLSAVLLFNCRYQRDIEKKELELSKLSNPKEESYLKNKELLEQLEREISELMLEKKQLEPAAKRAFSKRERALQTLKENHPEQYLYAKDKLDADLAESQDAIKRLDEVKYLINKKRTLKTNVNGRVKDAEKTHAKYRTKEKELRALKNALIAEEVLYQCLKEEMRWFHTIFGTDFYVEIQNHGMPEERDVMPILAKAAEEENICLVATNDVHIAERKDVEARQFMRSLRFERWDEITAADQELYMKSDKELYGAVLDVVGEENAKKAILGIRDICSQCHVIFPDATHYPRYRDDSGKEVEDSATLLRLLAEQGIPKRFPGHTFTEQYRERMAYELDVIISLGYADYLLIVADFIQFAKKQSQDNEEHIGYGVGIGRGSGAGSLVNYLLGITGLDPIKYGLIFERFLNKDRVSMPDIDTDFSDEVRQKTIEYVRQKYGEESVACIRTTTTQGAKGSAKNSARIRGYELFPGKNTDASVKAKRKPVRSLGDAIAKEIPLIPGIKLANCEENFEKFMDNPDGAVIIERAKAVEGTTTSLSIHAAGIIIGDGPPLKNYVPLLYNTAKNQWAVQCDMEESEKIGLLKMDFLGLNNLDVISECIRRVKSRYGEHIDLDHLPFESEVFHHIFALGNTSCVFQFESSGMKQMLRDFKPECFEDIILLVAAYRPGPMDFIPDIIDTKFGKKKAHYMIPQLKEILEPTYGCPIYQEQLMDIFHQCAGFTLGKADIIRRHMSKKHEKEFLAYKPDFISGFVSSGASEKEAEVFWTSLVDFSKYAFNKSHAAAYAMIAYQTAYLKYHYPQDYMCSVMNHADIKKLPELLYECREMGIQVLPPDINRSYLNFTTDCEGNVMYGLNSIKGIDKYAVSIIQDREIHGFYESFMDFMLRAHQNKGVTEKLIRSGVFDVCDESGRSQLLSVLDIRVKYRSELKKKLELTKKVQAEYDNCKNAEERKKVGKRLASAKECIERAKIKLYDTAPKSTAIENKLENLTAERELLGAYISGHPLDSYENAFQDDNITLIRDFESGKVHSYLGLISNIRLANRKSDGAKMAFFTLEDITGTIEVNCFTNAYQKYGALIKEGDVVEIAGKGSYEAGFSDEDDPVKKLSVQYMKIRHPEKTPLFLSVKDEQLFQNEIIQSLKAFEDDRGFPVYLHYTCNGDIRKLELYLSPDILEAEIPGMFVEKLYCDTPKFQK